jgi:RimJ/RimL family protein N-acetyltransferase
MVCRVEDPPLADAAGSRFTKRLRLEPAGPASAVHLWLVHKDDEVWPWYGGEKPGLGQMEQRAKFMGDSWRLHGVHKWIAYDRVSGEVVGRGGLSRTPVDDDWGQIYASEIGRAGLAFCLRRPRRAGCGVVQCSSQRSFARRNGAPRHAVRG